MTGSVVAGSQSMGALVIGPIVLGAAVPTATLVAAAEQGPAGPTGLPRTSDTMGLSPASIAALATLGVRAATLDDLIAAVVLLIGNNAQGELTSGDGTVQLESAAGGQLLFGR